MMEKVKPDIVSVATQPEPRSEIVTYVANNGAKAIYAEKAMAASMPEAEASPGLSEIARVALPSRE